MNQFEEELNRVLDIDDVKRGYFLRGHAKAVGT